MSSGYIPPQDEPGPEEIREALKRASRDHPGLKDFEEEVAAHLLVFGGYLEKKPSPAIVAELLGELKGERGAP